MTLTEAIKVLEQWRNEDGYGLETSEVLRSAINVMIEFAKQEIDW